MRLGDHCDVDAESELCQTGEWDNPISSQQAEINE